MSWFINHWPGATIERHSLSHALAGVPAPSEREPGGAAPLIVPPGSRNIAGDFHRPYESSEEFTFYHSTDYTLSELVTMLQGQQFRLPGNPSSVSGQISICTNDPVAWDDNRYRIVTNGTAHRLSGNLRH